MFNISKYLDKTIKTLSSNSEKKEKILSSIIKCTNLHLNKEALEIKEEIIYLNTTQAIKNKIFINKKEILADLVENSEKFIDIK